MREVQLFLAEATPATRIVRTLQGCGLQPASLLDGLVDAGRVPQESVYLEQLTGGFLHPLQHADGSFQGIVPVAVVSLQEPVR